MGSNAEDCRFGLAMRRYWQRSNPQWTKSAGLTMDDWDEFEHVQMNETDEKIRADWRCWMERYLTDCTVCPACPDDDPFQ